MNLKLQAASGWVLSVFIFAAAGAEPPTSARIQDLVQQGKLDEALSATDAELDNDKASVTYRFLKGSILTRLNRLDEAAAIFLKLTDEHPELPEPYNNLAVVHAAQGDFEKARLALQKAINTHPSYATAHENLGDIYAKMASQAYNHALQLDQDNSTAKSKLSLITSLFPAPQPAPATVAQAAPAKAPQTAEEPAAEKKPVAQAPTPAVSPPPVASVPAAMPAPAPATATKTVADAASAAPAVAAASSESPAPAPPAAEPAASREAVRRAVDLWATAWSAQDVDAYLACYADDFSSSSSLSRSQWAAQRRERLAAPRFIKVEIADFNVAMLGGDHAQATFLQGYQSDSINDRIRKMLLLKKSGDRWLITQETNR